MIGKTVFITGGTSGIGKETARQLAAKGASVILSGRNETSGKQTVADIGKSTGNKDISFIQVDLCSFISVINLARYLKENFSRIDVLINNAGFITDKCVITEDGVESQWSVNYLAPFLLTRLLLENNMLASGSRIINVSASAHSWVKELEYNYSCSIPYSGKKVYAGSKLALNMFTFCLSRKLAGQGITVNCLHPGVIRSNFKAQVLVPPALIFRYFFRSPAAGAKSSVFLASDDSIKNVTGRYFENDKQKNPSTYSLNTGEQEKLWNETEKIVKLQGGFLPDDPPAFRLD